jgi:hypothetical protein
MNKHNLDKNITVLETQQIMLDKSGYIIENAGNIIDIKSSNNKSLVGVFPFLESIFMHLLQLELDSPEIKFKNVEHVINGKLGLYDYSFIRIEMFSEDHVILWTITNLTPNMEQIKQKRIAQNKKDVI